MSDQIHAVERPYPSHNDDNEGCPPGLTSRYVQRLIAWHVS